LKRITFELAMKKLTLKGTIKWRITIKMDNEDEEHAPILSYAWKNSGVVYFMSTYVIEEEILLW
jgi:3-deoxy-D-manno-octulosonic-acid transferase